MDVFSSAAALRAMPMGSLLRPNNPPGVLYNAVALKIGSDVWVLTAYQGAQKSVQLLTDFSPEWVRVVGREDGEPVLIPIERIAYNGDASPESLTTVVDDGS